MDIIKLYKEYLNKRMYVNTTINPIDYSVIQSSSDLITSDLITSDLITNVPIEYSLSVAASIQQSNIRIQRPVRITLENGLTIETSNAIIDFI